MRIDCSAVRSVVAHSRSSASDLEDGLRWLDSPSPSEIITVSNRQVRIVRRYDIVPFNSLVQTMPFFL